MPNNLLIFFVLYLYFVQYLHVLQDSKCHLTPPTAQVQPNSQVTDIPQTERHGLKDAHLLTSLRFFSLPGDRTQWLISFSLLLLVWNVFYEITGNQMQLVQKGCKIFRSPLFDSNWDNKIADLAFWAFISFIIAFRAFECIGGNRKSYAVGVENWSD